MDTIKISDDKKIITATEEAPKPKDFDGIAYVQGKTAMAEIVKGQIALLQIELDTLNAEIKQANDGGVLLPKDSNPQPSPAVIANP